MTVEGGMDLRAMLMKRKVKQKKIVQKIIEWTEVRNNLLFKLIIRPVEARSLTASIYIQSVTFLYVSLLFDHNFVKNAHKTKFFRPKILKWFLYKPNQSVLRYL